MRRLLILALGASAILATTSAQAHNHLAKHESPVPAKAISFDVAPDSVAVVASLTTGPTFHVSSRPSYSGFRSTSSRSYSAPATRSYSAPRTYSFRPSSPSISMRPAATSTPRTYTYSISGVPHTKAYTPAPSSPPAEVHHYHDGGSRGGGLSATDVILLNAALNSNHQNQLASAPGSTGRFVSDTDSYVPAQADKPDDGLSGWLIFGIIVLVVGGIVYGAYRYIESD